MKRPKTFNEQLDWAISHGSCDPNCEGRCVVCPRDVLEECKKLLAQRPQQAEPVAWNEVDVIAKKRDAALRAYRVLRAAVDAMLAPLGYYGEISARDDRVQSVMDAMAQCDEVER